MGNYQRSPDRKFSIIVYIQVKDYNAKEPEKLRAPNPDEHDAETREPDNRCKKDKAEKQEQK